MTTTREATRTVTLRNSFHNTSVRVRIPAVGWPVEILMDDLEYRWWRDHNDGLRRNESWAGRLLGRIRRTLCGMSDCQCGGGPR
jgi:hypothetical protein